MNYIYAYVAPFSDDGCIEIEVKSESEILDILQEKLGLTNEFDSLDEMLSFIEEYNMLELEGGERISIATLSGEMIFWLA